jgi:uncharacterized protein
VIPPAPTAYFTDTAGLASPATARAIDARLEQFERSTSDQVLVAVFPTMQSDSSVDDYAVRVFQAWKVGRKGLDNGVVLFVFADTHKIWITTGYGMEGSLPDALCRRIIANEIVPRFRAGDFDGGLRSGVEAILAATQGAYHGTGSTVADSGRVPFGLVRLVLIVLLIIVWSLFRSQQHVVYGAGGRTRAWGGGPWIFPGGGGFGGGGGGGGFGGGGFSGGGGGSGGGGAGGSW